MFVNYLMEFISSVQLYIRFSFFAIDIYHNCFCKGALDFDSNSQNYTIGLNASDGTNIGIASLFIRITDENDIIPQINNTVLSVTLPENATAGLVITLSFLSNF